MCSDQKSSLCGIEQNLLFATLHFVIKLYSRHFKKCMQVRGTDRTCSQPKWPVLGVIC